jgi:hypothetical protein
VLGNAGNRFAFKDRFWWDEDTGLFNYLKTICGVNVQITTEDGKTRPPRIVADLTRRSITERRCATGNA